MDNQDITRFFADSGLADQVERRDEPPTAMWIFQAGRVPVFIQTQENVNRLRIIALIAEADTLGRDELAVLLEANYHTALDARYALADDQLVAAFLHPLHELTLTQFVLGLHQAICCAETCGTSFSGGTLVFGQPSFTDGKDESAAGGPRAQAHTDAEAEADAVADADAAAGTPAPTADDDADDNADNADDDAVADDQPRHATAEAAIDDIMDAVVRRIRRS